MNKKSITPLSLLITSILIVSLGLTMLFKPLYVQNIITTFIPFLFIGMGVLQIIAYVFNKNKKELKTIISGVLYISLALLLKYKIIFIQSSIVFIVGVYAFINFLAQSISTIILYNDKTKEWIFSGITTITSLIFSMLLIRYPIQNRFFLSSVASIYLILFGFTIFRDFMMEISDVKKIKNNLRRKIRIRLPIIYTAFIPQKMLEHFNEKLTTSSDKMFIESKTEESGELEVFIHLAKNVAKGFGHIDICYKDKIYSYGTYDSKSNRLFNLVSDGVLIEVDREKYIEFNTKNRHLVSFVLTLTEKQCNAVSDKIEQIKGDCKSWYCDLNQNNQKDYTCSLFLHTNAKFYKFKKGYFKTYFVLTSNCVRLADNIIGSAGIDAITINGIITPGIYFNYLNNLFLMNNTIVIRRNTYNISK